MPWTKEWHRTCYSCTSATLFDYRTEEMLLIDARNAFNSLNRDLVLKNIRKHFSSIYTAIRKSYKTPSDLFTDKKVIMSQEGRTQVDPKAEAMYGMATIPVIDMLEDQYLTVMCRLALNPYDSCSISSMNMALQLSIMLSNVISLQNLSCSESGRNFFRIRAWRYGRSSSSWFSY